MSTDSLPSTELRSFGDRLEETEDEPVESGGDNTPGGATLVGVTHLHDAGLNRQHVTIDLLPDNVLLEVFDLYRLRDSRYASPWPWRWHTLVHVCQRWRYIILASPCRLDLRLLCTKKTPAKESLHIWPTLPIEINDGYSYLSNESEGCKNVHAALEHHDRVSGIKLTIEKSPLERWATVIQKPFPALMHLELRSNASKEPLVLPDGFLGGFAPRLQTISLSCIAFPALPKLLSSSKDLVCLTLNNIPPSCYISPEAMVTGLSGLTNLESLTFRYPLLWSSPHQRSENPPPVTRVIIPALTEFKFTGDCGYLDDLVAQIDAPLLANFEIMFADEPFLWIRHLPQFIDRTEELGSPDFARLQFCRRGGMEMTLQKSRGSLKLTIPRGQYCCEIRLMMQICEQSLLTLSTVKTLRIRKERSAEMKHVDWVEFCRPFTAVENIHVCRALGPLVGALGDLAYSRKEHEKHVLPALKDVWEGRG